MSLKAFTLNNQWSFGVDPKYPLVDLTNIYTHTISQIFYFLCLLLHKPSMHWSEIYFDGHKLNYSSLQKLVFSDNSMLRCLKSCKQEMISGQVLTRACIKFFLLKFSALLEFKLSIQLLINVIFAKSPTGIVPSVPPQEAEPAAGGRS